MFMRTAFFAMFMVAMILLFGDAYAQSSSTPSSGTASTSLSSTTAPATSDNMSTVYFYRYKQFSGSALKPSIYCDGVELLRMQNGRFYKMQIPAGEHTCYANDKQAGVIIKFEPGKDYFFRTSLQVGVWKGHFRLEMVMPEQGKYDITKLKPLDSDKVAVTAGALEHNPLAAQ